MSSGGDPPPEQGSIVPRVWAPRCHGKIIGRDNRSPISMCMIEYMACLQRRDRTVGTDLQQ